MVLPSVRSLLLLATIFLRTNAYRQPYEYIDAFKRFGDSIISPQNEKYAKEIEAPFFSEDVVGRVDDSTNFFGAELNTEYIYGVWVQVASQNISLLGSPTSYTLQSLAVEPPIVSGSIIINYSYPIVQFELPVQVDLWLRFTDELQISSYDVTFRRWPAALEYFVPKLLPSMAAASGQKLTSDSNTTEIIARFLAQQICSVSTEYCTGDNQQYDSNQACMKFLTENIPLGNPWEGGYDTVLCRYVHKNMVSYRPEVHCPHVGPTGGGMCIARDYIQVVMGYPFTETLNSPNASWNGKDLAGLSQNSLDELLKLNTMSVVPTTVAWYSISTIVLWAILYFSARGVRFILTKCSGEFRRLSYENQCTSVMYVLSTFYTTVALVLQLVAAPVLARVYTLNNVSILRVVALLISAIYLFELTYRPSMRWQLLTHHFVTLFVIILILVLLQVTERPAFVNIGDIWLFQATTEQSVLIALFLYRLKCRLSVVRLALYIAAIQATAFKFGFAIYLFVFWGMHQAKNNSTRIDVTFNVFFVILLVCLMLVQWIGSSIVWEIARTLESRYDAVGRSKLQTMDIEKENEYQVRVYSPGSSMTTLRDFEDPRPAPPVPVV